jgi:hypothetical protein
VKVLDPGQRQNFISSPEISSAKKKRHNRSRIRGFQSNRVLEKGAERMKKDGKEWRKNGERMEKD